MAESSSSNTLDPDALCQLASGLVASGQPMSAMKYYQNALDINPVHTRALCELADLQMAGPHYLEVLADFHRQLEPKCYVEIGVCKGHSFKLVSADTRAIGIDPAPQLDIEKLPGKHIVISDTSDNYFAGDRFLDDMNGASLDLAFIDGMHLFEYALRDFVNLEKYSTADTVILVHDVYPMNEPTARRERIADFWSGDVWKLIICLKQLRPDLSVHVLPCPPTGLGVITNLSPDSSILRDQLEDVTREFVDLPFSVLGQDVCQTLSVINKPVNVSAFIQAIKMKREDF